VVCGAEIAVPAASRAIIIGKGGNRIRELEARTGVRMTVPGRDRPEHHKVRVEGEDIASVLHLCRELTELGIGREDPVECTVMTAEGSVSLSLLLHPSGEFLQGSGFSAFWMTSRCTADEVDVLVDNERFARPGMSATCDVRQAAQGGRLTILVYGRDQEEPRALFEGLVNATTSAEAHKLAHSVAQESLPANTFTVGTWNLLHPRYAEKYREREGIGKDGKSNWPARAPHIANMLARSNLDVYLLQEVDEEQLAGLVSSGGLSGWDVHHCTHPNREARDGVAVLLRRQSFCVVAKEMVPFEAKEKERRGQHYMCAAVTFAVHTETKLRIAVASVHFYSKKSVDPQATLLEFFKQRSADYDAVVWGGDCNNVFRQAPAGYVWEEASQHRPTRRASGKKIDWIFVTLGAPSVQRCAAAELLPDASRLVVPETGFAPSDHFAEAVAVTLSCAQAL
jgi:endonuclease/exonuclease/phosphatase family metal-dependent hydrolase